MILNSTKEIIEDLRQGKIVIIMDDEDRENEGDLLIAGDKVTPEAINFMARFGRGLICLTLTEERCQQLQLPMMVSDQDTQHATNFTVSIEAADGVTTGISAADRATTILAAVAPDAQPEDLNQPGHIFPLMAQPGGVLVRAGHTEAGCDLARLAGLSPTSVIVEILNENGSMARRPDLEVVAKEHGLKIGTIADLIEYRVSNEKTVERVTECHLPTSYGEFNLVAYQDCIDDELHLALVLGEVDSEQPVLVRVHMQNSLNDLFDTTRIDQGLPLHKAMNWVSQEGQGIIVVLRNHDSSREIIQRMRAYQIHEEQGKAPKRDKGKELRTFGVGAQILSDLGVRKMRVLSAPKSFHGISGFGLEVVEYVCHDCGEIQEED
ncbi:3,4-dihydroxy-2-butanone 4-phosphate synthase / GTP cyclohydrolase II [hydrothermal vent metagenome]|uniref:3,4-dihydroxy-2-butanone 4-phosphate synthase / GTP cyclohydrolase II n=1 Tax=hydrothermal vent metagenome TaxID=652676 RepID=A0A3B1AXE0_9ZZZZ